MRRSPWLWVPWLALAACDDGGGAPQEATPGGAPPGARFVDYIRGERFPRLVLEVDFVPGSEPGPGVFDVLADGLSGLLDKPAGIEAVFDEELAPRGSDHVWTFEELEALGAATLGDAPPGTIQMHFLYVDGRSELDADDQRILGVAWDYTHVAIFKDTIDAACQRLPAEARDGICAAAELGIVTHETGHLLGLVDLGLPMVVPHEDPERPGHDRNEDCIMFWLYEGQALVEALQRRMTDEGTPDLGFDDACLDDLANVRDAP